MAKTGTTSLPDLDAMMDIVAKFEAASKTDPALKNAELDELLRLVPGKRAVFTGDWHGQRAVFRIFLEAENQSSAREWAEMKRVWPAMNTGELRIAQPLHYSPSHGILVLEEVTGTPLMQHIWRSDPAERVACLPPSAAWLRAYTQATEAKGKARAGVWLERAERATLQQPHARLKRREAKVLEHLRRLAPLCEALPWRSAISHGDFHPNNLIKQDNRLTGVDLGGSHAMPIYKDMARFLMHMGRRGLIPSGQSRFGVDTVGIEAFADAFDLTPTERDLLLPFLLGVEALLRVEHAGIKPGRIQRAAEMTDQLISDLAQL